MNIRLNVHEWEKLGNTSLTGAYFSGSEVAPCSPADLGDTIEDASNALAKANGFFAIVRSDDRGVLAAVDKTRSIPLFYSIHGSELYLSDDANWIAGEIGFEEPGAIDRREFLACGYVTGSDTLHPRIRQLQAGEIAWFSDGRADLRRYYLYQHSEPSIAEPATLSSELSAVLDRCIDRLLAVADGRQIVLPLSGGHDSRLIAMLLHERKHKNVVAFSYGRPGNANAKVSQDVAAALGIEWHFIEYNAAIWCKHWNGGDADRFRDRSSNLVSLPHPQDWPAVRELLERGAIERSAIVVPGHSGDFLGGSHTPEEFFARKNFSARDLTGAIAKRHYQNVPTSRSEFSERIMSRIEPEFDGSDIAAANLFDLWDWQERQAKYIINSVRVYEQNGLSWWLPLFDSELMDFFSTVPLSLRRRRMWFRNWIDERFALNFGAQAVQGNADDARGIRALIVNAGRMLPMSLRDLLRPIYAKRAGEPDPMAFSVITGNPPAGYHMLGQWAAMQLDGRWSAISKEAQRQ